MTDRPTRDHAPNHAPVLSLMMVLQYAVWGVWLPLLALYLTAATDAGGLGFTGGQVGWILGVSGCLGALASPFLGGQIADRFMNAERYLAILLVVGGCVKFATASATTFPVFLALSIAYWVAYMPTLALTNSIAMKHLDGSERRFPRVRVWGTIGWILASSAFPLLWIQTDLRLTALPPFVAGVDKPNATALIADSLRVSGILSVLYGVWAWFFLPKTPPTRSVDHPLAFLRAFGLLLKRGPLVLTLVALPVAMIHNVYFMRASPFLEALGFQKAHIGPAMSVGQFAEIAVLAALGLLLRRLGYRGVVVLGCLAFAARYAIFSLATPETRPFVVASLALHGLCFGCFFAAAYLYIDRVAPRDARHSAQTVFTIVIFGLGPVLAGLYNEFLEGEFARALPSGERSVDWPALWSVQASIALVCAAVLALLFRPGAKPETAP
jgi:nucleoside transporter